MPNAASASRSTARPPRPPGYAKSADTRARILAAALEEASDCGIHNASLAAIATRAGVAIGSLNYHFGSRQELLRKLMASLTNDLLARLHDAHADDGTDFFAQQRAGLLVYLRHLRANPTFLRLAGEIRLHEPELHRQAVAGWVEQVAARIRDGVARGTLREMNDAEIRAQAYFIVGANHFLDHMMSGKGGRYPGDEAVAEAYLNLLRKGLARARPRGRRTGTRRGAARRPSRSRARRGTAR